GRSNHRRSSRPAVEDRARGMHQAEHRPDHSGHHQGDKVRSQETIAPTPQWSLGTLRVEGRSSSLERIFKTRGLKARRPAPAMFETFSGSRKSWQLFLDQSRESRLFEIDD